MIPIVRDQAIAGSIVLSFLLGTGITAHADSRPTSGDMSLLSGRTLGVGEAAGSAAVGWPGAYVELTLAAESTVNVGLRAALLYGSPVMGFGSGLGGQFSVPFRIHLLGSGQFDLALALHPAFVFGEGALVGERGIFASDFAYGLHVESFALAGLQVARSITVAFGAGAGLAFTGVFDTEASSAFAGSILVRAGVEALLSRDLMLFVELTGGYGLAPERLYDGHGIARAFAGIAYLF